jgi:hypothetical protein
MNIWKSPLISIIGGGFMVDFGLITAQITPEVEWLKWLPEGFRYRLGPLPAGRLKGVFSSAREVTGWAWNVPKNPEVVWGRRSQARLWQRVWTDIYQKQIKVIGVDPALSLPPPAGLKERPYFPGISDGKALELLLFIGRFRAILRSYEIPAPRAKALVVWEEGNLGVTCARLVAPEVRFLTLIHPNLTRLERAADLIMAETGISPQIAVVWPEDYKGAKIVIKCGKVTAFQLQRRGRRVIWCELFQKYPQLTLFNLNLPLSVWRQTQKLPIYPVWGETILRAGFNYGADFWYGPQLPLERVVKLARILNDLGAGITI